MTTTQSQRSPRMSDEQMAEMRDLVGSTSFKSIALSWTVGASFFMLLALWILGLTVVLLTQDVLLNAFPSIQRIWLWMSFIGVYLVISTFVALPLLFYIAFVRQGRMQTMTDMKAELEHYGWDEELMGDVVVDDAAVPQAIAATPISVSIGNTTERRNRNTIMHPPTILDATNVKKMADVTRWLACPV